MKKKIEYSEAPKDISEAIEIGEKVLDFLPPPSELAQKTEKVKVTITLSQRSIDFFKSQAQTNHTKYQTMINDVLDKYATKYMEEKKVRKTNT